MNFLERTVSGFIAAIERALFAEGMARRRGLLQSLDPRIKAAGVLALILAAAFSRRLGVLGALFGVALLLAIASRVPLDLMARRLWIAVLLFTGVIALPAPFLTAGEVVGRVPLLHWAVTSQGLLSAGFLIVRVETMATLSVLVILTTPWSHVLKALRVFRVPVIFVVMLGTTYRYIFLLLQTAQDMLESRRSRWVGKLSGRETRRVAAGSVGVLLTKSLQLSDDVYGAMLSRGFQGEVYVLHDFRARLGDWIALGILLILAGAAVFLGR
jgi:cobalt/nickel transport system permease protein